MDLFRRHISLSRDTLVHEKWHFLSNLVLISIAQINLDLAERED